MSNLILTICSNNKDNVEGEGAYDVNARKIADLLPKKMADVLYNTRQSAYNHIAESGAKRDDTPLTEMEYNKGLVEGPDITNIARGAKRGKYLPARERYTGRFYSKFNDNVSPGQTPHLSGENCDNHLLIVSGLYGVLAPTEPIQRYSCNVQDQPETRKRWKKSGDNDTGLLTRILASYIETFNINRVFDFMADDSYRHLIEWESMADKTGCTIFYTHSEQQKGADMLMGLGDIAGRLISGQAEKKLSNIRSGDSIDGIEFSEDPPEWIPGGAISKKWTSHAAWVVSMGANIETFLTEAGVPEEDAERNKSLFLLDRINRFENNKNYRPEVGQAMHEIRIFRNDVIHENHVPDQNRVFRIRKQYKIIADWAKKCDYSGLANLKDVDY